MKTTRTGFLLRVAAVVLGIYLIYNIFSLQGQITQKQQRLDVLQQQVEAGRLENEELTEAASQELTDEEYAEIAREQLGYAYPNERIFVDITGK